MSKLKLIIFLILCLVIAASMSAQTVSGVITDATDSTEPLIGVSITVDGSSRGTITDLDGTYSLDLPPGTYTLIARYVGFTTSEQEITLTEGQSLTADFILDQGVNIDEVVVIGTRAPNRTNTDSPVPVDVINISKLSLAAPQTDMNQLLNATTPSFSSNTQTISDGTDHIDPASLRGLGPDQVLVLVNGKRRHTTSLVNVNGTFGRGNVGTDLNALPASATGAVEVLRDGAAAQYGSDAIAGVINFRLKESVNELTVNVTTGANFTSEIGPFNGETKSIDGEVFNLGVNYGLPLGDKGGFINLTGEFSERGSTNRMQEFRGGIFSNYNGIERVARAAGADVSALSLADVQRFASSVSYISGDAMSAINSAGSLSELSDALGADATDAELSARGLQRSDFNMRVGQSELRGGKAFMNMAIPVGDDLELYSFGGMSFRNGTSGCFYRLPNQSRTTTAIYPNGTVPKINSNISDKSLSFGLRGKINDWSVDFSNTFGMNEFLYRMTDTHNATLGASSPTAFNVGGHNFIQNTTNFDITQYIEAPGSMKGINVAFGAEYRYENYNVEPGTERSFGNFDINGNLVNSITHSDLLTTDILGRGRPSGSQCFAGFLPTNEVDARRSSVAGYADVEFDFSDEFLLAAAIRAENYSDFGSTFNYKLASRYKLNNNFSIRGALSTGFRAPSLHQINYSKTSTIFELINGVSVPQERGTFANDSRAAQLLGIPQLKQETSTNISLGFTAKIPNSNLKITVDAYQVNIDDRVILTGAFSAGSDPELQLIFDQAGATAATFFSNAIDTKSKGLDIVIAHNAILSSGVILRNDFAATFSKTTWDQDAGINASPLLREKGLVSTYFNQSSRIYLEQAVPRTKFTLSNTLDIKGFSVYLRNTYFGETTEAINSPIFDSDLNLTDNSIDPYNSGKILTDLSVGYRLSEGISLTVGAQNLLDVYPDIADASFQSSGRFIYSRRSPQFSFGGRHLFARAVFTFK